MMLQSLSGALALLAYAISGVVALFYFAEVSNVRNFPFVMRFAILAFAVFNIFTVFSAFDRMALLSPEMPRAMAEMLLSLVLFWRAMDKRSERKCRTLPLPTS